MSPAEVTIEPCPTRAGAGRLTAEQVIARPRPEVFAFYGDAGNLNRLTPPWVQFRILTPMPIAMGVGTLIDYRIRVRGVPMRWRTRITAWDPPHRFVDEQIRGPYTEWIHEHEFEEVGGGTRVLDRVSYRTPLSWVPGAGVIEKRLVRPDLMRIFSFRCEALAGVFG